MKRRLDYLTDTLDTGKDTPGAKWISHEQAALKWALVIIDKQLDAEGAALEELL